MRTRIHAGRILFVPIALLALLAGGAAGRLQDACGPFTDVSPALCPYVLEMYFLGITAGTSPTTYSPDATLTRGQAAVFVSKGLNQAIARSSRRAALGQWWMPSYRSWDGGLGSAPLPSNPGPFGAMASDGTDVWVGGYGSVFRFRASDGKYLETWPTGRTASALLPAMGRIFVAGFQLPSGGPGALYGIDPAKAAGDAVLLADLDGSPFSLAFDGWRLWATTESGIAIVTPASSAPWPVTMVTEGFGVPSGLAFDGKNMWAVDPALCALFRLDSSGAIEKTVTLGSPNCAMGPPVFDGVNLLLPTTGGFLVVRAGEGALVQTVSVGGGGSGRVVFDGERILFVGEGGGQTTLASLTILRAADFSPLQAEYFPPFGGPGVTGGATDGLNFWLIAQGLANGPSLARY